MDDDCDNDSRNSSNAEENSYALILTASEEDLNLEDCYNFTTYFKYDHFSTKLRNFNIQHIQLSHKPLVGFRHTQLIIHQSNYFYR